MSDTKPTTDLELAAGLRALVTNVMDRFASPHGVPLTSDEQAAFIRSVYWQAKELSETEPFLRAQAEAAALAYVKEVKRQQDACDMVAASAASMLTDRPAKRAMRKTKS